jgi:hypothetical protein
LTTHRLVAQLAVLSHWLSPCARSLHLSARLLRAPPLDFCPVALALAVRPVTASRGATTHRPDYIGSTAPMPCTGRAVSTLDFFQSVTVALVVCPVIPLCVVTTCLTRGRNGYSSLMPRVWVLRHVARLVTRLVAPLVVDYYAYAARPGALARHAARHAARRRLLRLCRMSGCLDTSRGSSRFSSRRSSSTSTMPRVWLPWHVVRLIAPLVVDYFAYVARPGASARHAAHHAARRRLIRLRRASRCLDTSRVSLSTSSPTPRV